MANEKSQQPIIIKRVKKSAAGHHGGAWKIAYADFVTAMMAFFLLMWLLGSTSKGDKEGISEYFKTPLKVALAGGSGSGDSSSVIKGGGQNLTRSSGQVKKGDTMPEKKRAINLEAAKAELERLEVARLNDLKGKLEEIIDVNPVLRQFKKQLLLDITSEGLRIQIVDEQNRPMFSSGSAQLQPYTRDILHEIGKALNAVSNRISLSGHTDAKPYPSGEKGYSNWELSADRANASRRELIAGGMAEDKMLRVVGLSSAVLFEKNNPLHPVNRRISIIVMNRKTEEAISSEGENVQVSSEQQVSKELLSGGNLQP